jgi:hypothetical protein
LGSRALRSALIALSMGSATCAAVPPPNAPATANAVPADVPSAAAPPGEEISSATFDVDPGQALQRSSEEGEVVVRADVLRGHVVGARCGPVLATWPGWRATLHAITADPVADLDWIDVVGPSDAAGQRMVARVAGETAEAALEGRLVALQARSAEPAELHVEGRIPAAAARLDGTLRVVFRPEARFVAASDAARGPALSKRLEHARVQAPETATFDALVADIPRPHDTIGVFPAAIRRLRAHVSAMPAGGADASAEGTCDSADDATRAASTLKETIARQNFALVHMLTHGLLDGVDVAAEGPVVKIRLRATRDQLEALLALVLPLVAPGASTGR